MDWRDGVRGKAREEEGGGGAVRQAGGSRGRVTRAERCEREGRAAVSWRLRPI
jgi:hypothetical protein